MQASISGASGFIGNLLWMDLAGKGWKISFIDRKSFEMNDDEFIAKNIEGSDVVINLAGAPIQKRWNESYKKEIRDSRILTTRKIVSAIRNAERKPSLFISGSAIGIYSPAGTHTENSTDLADDFLGKVCREWEHEALEASGLTRVVISRTGVVLGKNGGALQAMVTPFKMGLGGTIGNGKQPFSWIHEADLVSAFSYVIENTSLTGIINLVAPNPTTNYHFTKTLGKALKQPAVLRIPEISLKMLYGEGAQAIITGQNVIPEKLLNAGFSFSFPTIEKALLNLYR